MSAPRPCRRWRPRPRTVLPPGGSAAVGEAAAATGRWVAAISAVVSGGRSAAKTSGAAPGRSRARPRSPRLARWDSCTGPGPCSGCCPWTGRRLRLGARLRREAKARRRPSRRRSARWQGHIIVGRCTRHEGYFGTRSSARPCPPVSVVLEWLLMRPARHRESILENAVRPTGRTRSAAAMLRAPAARAAAVIALVTRGRNLRTALLLRTWDSSATAVQHNAGFMLASKMATR